MPNHFTLTFFLLRRRDVSCSHSNRDLFTCEDNMLFSHVKISCFRAKAHLVFHWYLYNKGLYHLRQGHGILVGTLHNIKAISHIHLRRCVYIVGNFFSGNF